MSEKLEKKDNILLNFMINIIIPVIILSKFSKPENLGPIWGLVIALAFPLFYGIYDLLIKKKKNFISILGFCSILITGVIGLLKLPAHFIAVKEAFIPFLIGLVIFISTFTPFLLVKRIIYIKDILDTEKIDSLLDIKNSRQLLDKLLKRVSILVASTFFLSAVLNYILAKIVVKSEAGTTAFNEELARMTLLSYPVIVVPLICCILLIFFYFLRALKKITGLTVNDLFSSSIKDKEAS